MGAASQELTERAKLLIAERRYQEAVRACRRALLSKPDDVDLRLLLGEALLALERYDEVRVEMIALTRRAPLRGDVHRILGEAYLRDHRPQQALDALTRAMELDPEDEVARDLIGEAADETAPVSTTIERWFAGEAERTVETESPSWEEEHTGPVPLPSPATLPSQTPPPPKVQVDPSLIAAFAPSDPPRAAPPARPRAEPDAPAHRTDPARPRAVRSRKATALGMPMGDNPFGDLPSSDETTNDRPLTNPFTEPLPAESTHAARPSAFRPDDPITEELSLDEQEIVPTSASPLPAPTRRAEASGDYESLESLEELDELETAAYADGLPVSPYPQSEGTVPDPPLPARPSAAPLFPTPGDGVAVDPRFAQPNFAPIAEPDLPPAAPPVAPHVAAPAPARMPAQAPAPKPRPMTGSSRSPRRKMLVPILAGVVALFIVGAVGGIVLWVVLGASEVAEVRASAAEAGDSGSRAQLEAVLEEIGDDDDPELVALAARTLATLTLEHDQDRAAEVRARLDGMETPTPTDAAIALALLAIDDGRPEDANRAIADMPARGESIAEGFRAAALASYQLGRWPRAAEMAERAFQSRPQSPRHLALYALTQHRVGSIGEAITLLENHPEHETHPALRSTLARILQESTRDPERAAEEAAAVIDQLADRATPPQLAWARLVRAAHRADEGDAVGALEDARAAAEHPPAWDPMFGVQLVEVLMRAGAPGEASEQIARLRPPPPDGETDRALLEARVALAVGELDRAEQALGRAGEGTAQSLLRAQLLEARGRPGEARPLYERVLDAPGPEGRRARVRLAAMAMREGDSERAVELLEPAHAAASDDLEIVPLLARAYLGEDQAGDAERVIEAALRRREGAAELLAARGALQLHRGQNEAALASLRQAAEARPSDPDLAADLGAAALRAGQVDDARAAFERSLELRDDHPRALVGMARLALRASRFDDAERRLEAAVATGQEALEVARLRGELHVARGDGVIGVEALEADARRLDDAAVWTALGDLQSQAELDRDAGRSYDRALRADRGYPEALLGRSLVFLRLGSLSGADNAIDDAAAQAERRGLTDALGPRIAVARGRLLFERARFDEAVERANEAIEADGDYGPAHLLLANVYIEQSRSPDDALRAAVEGHPPPPEAVGRRAIRLGRGDDACTLAARYLEVAPRGYDAGEVRDVHDRCR